jgi:hypothetical protein
MKEKKDVAREKEEKPIVSLFRKSGPVTCVTLEGQASGYVSPARYCRIPLAVMVDRSLSLSARCVYGLLSLAVFQGNVSIASNRVMAGQLGISRESVRRAVKELLASEHVKMSNHKRGGKPNYELLSPVFGKKQGAIDEVYISPDGSKKRLVSVEARPA